MAFFRPRHPVLRAIFAIGSALFYLLSIPWVRKQAVKLVKWPFRKFMKHSGKMDGKIVDATAKVVDDKNV